MLIKINVPRPSNQRRIELAKKASIRATTRAVDRMGLYVESRAVFLTPVNEGTLRQSGYKTDALFDTVTDTASCGVGFSAAHAIYVEMGFRGHFVPFHIADGLYYEALRKWGWRVPDPQQIHHKVAGRRYLIPIGRKTPVWGVFVSGTAQPFLRPALSELFDQNHYSRILQEEFNVEYAKLEALHN